MKECNVKRSPNLQAVCANASFFGEINFILRGQVWEPDCGKGTGLKKVKMHRMHTLPFRLSLCRGHPTARGWAPASGIGIREHFLPPDTLGVMSVKVPL